ncbi:hypothetical protein BDZ97DRAFT_1856306 [Flammula alnicola]|nr:hypothetical protein BDZ97DRAFT_1856306 [Flammula alnicola]
MNATPDPCHQPEVNLRVDNHVRDIDDYPHTFPDDDPPPRISGAIIIPDDILSEIFYAALYQEEDGATDFDSTVPMVSYLSNTDPVQLGHVCSHWRTVALGTSKLWSSVCIDHPRGSHVNLTKLWMERAKTHPLKLTIKTEVFLPIDPSPFLEILEILITKLEYWKEIDFDLPQEVILNFSKILQQRRTEFQQLESATISVHSRQRHFYKIKDHDSSTQSPIDSIWEAIHSSSSLRHVNWKNLYEGRPLPNHCPWNRLTRIKLDYHIAIDKLLEVLSLSPNMEDFRAGGLSKSFVSTRTVYPTPIVLEKLHTLYLTTPDNAGEFFANVTLPALQNLHITYPPPPTLWGQERRNSSNEASKFQQFLSRSKCFLKDVWLNTPPFDDNDLRSHLASTAFQSVVHLRITGANLITDNTIRFFTSQQMNTDIMPGVECLWFEMRDTEVTDGLLSAMVASRWLLEIDQTTRRCPARLREARFTKDFWRDFGPQDIKGFSDMLGQGLHVSISPGALGMQG